MSDVLYVFVLLPAPMIGYSQVYRILFNKIIKIGRYFISRKNNCDPILISKIKYALMKRMKSDICLDSHPNVVVLLLASFQDSLK